MKRINTFFICIAIMLVFCSIPIFAHTHNGLCYNDNTHSHTGDAVNGGGCYQTAIPHTHNDSCYSTQCNFNALTTSTEDLIMYDTQCTKSDCLINSGEILFNYNAVKFTYTCSVCGATNSCIYCAGCSELLGGSEEIVHKEVSIDVAKANPNIFSICNKTNNGYSLSCGMEEGKNYGELICNTTILKIEPVQTIQVGTLDTNVVVTYLDEHTEVKNATSNYNSKQQYNSSVITLSYGGFETNIIYSTNNNNSIIVSDETINNQIDVDTTLNIPVLDETKTNTSSVDIIIEDGITIIDETIITPRPTSTPTPTETITPILETNNDSTNNVIDNTSNNPTNTNTDTNATKNKNVAPIVIIVLLLIVGIFSGVVFFIKKKK